MSLNLIPHSATPLNELLTRAAFAPLPNVGWIRITGEDRVRWLNGMVTNSIQELKPGEGCYNFFLNAQGRIQGDSTAWMMEDSILLETAADRVAPLMAMLDHFIIMDDVELKEVQHFHGLLLAGPMAEQLLALAPLPIPAAGISYQIAGPEDDNNNPFLILRTGCPLVPRFEIWCYEDKREGICGFIGSNLNTAQVGAEDLEQLRILEGTPLYGVDIRDKDLPQETNQTRALHFSKGCYLGQEIVERIRSRGNVHRTFSGFVLEGELPAAGVALTVDEKPVGELTSVARIQLPSGAVQLALGYIRREMLERDATIHYLGGTATPAKLPFSLPELRV